MRFVSRFGVRLHSNGSFFLFLTLAGASVNYELSFLRTARGDNSFAAAGPSALAPYRAPCLPTLWRYANPHGSSSESSQKIP
jgi:hypothetical protein